MQQIHKRNEGHTTLTIITKSLLALFFPINFMHNGERIQNEKERQKLNGATTF